MFFRALLGLLLTPVVLAGDTPMPDRDPELTARIKSLTPGEIHAIVKRLEVDPLHKDAEALRAGLVLYYEDVDFIFCVTKTVAEVSNTRMQKWHRPVWMQVILGSGDFVTQHPDRLDDPFAYTLAGWQSALRAYEAIRAQKPKAKLQALEDLIAIRDAGKLEEYVRDNLCDEDEAAGPEPGVDP